MSDTINTTTSPSPRDYAMSLHVLSDAELQGAAENNYWCFTHLQQVDVDYGARYQACLALQLQRGHDDFVNHSA